MASKAIYRVGPELPAVAPVLPPEQPAAPAEISLQYLPALPPTAPHGRLHLTAPAPVPEAPAAPAAPKRLPAGRSRACSGRRGRPEPDYEGESHYCIRPDGSRTGFGGGRVHSFKKVHRPLHTKRKELLQRFTPQFVRRCQNLYETRGLLKSSPGLSASEGAGIFRNAGAVSWCFAGEGGIMAALWDYFDEFGLGFEMKLRKLPLLQETVEVCEVFDVNHLQAAIGRMRSPYGRKRRRTR